MKAENNAHIETMQTLITSGRQSARSKSFFHYAIGKESEDLGDWPSAFEAFTRGAAARRGTIEFNESDEIDMFEAIKATYTADWLSQCAPGSNDSSPIFVLGQPRTGTGRLDVLRRLRSYVLSTLDLSTGSHGPGSLRSANRASQYASGT